VDVIEVRVLGPVELWADGHRVEIGPPQRRTVLAALVVDAGQQVTLQELVDRVWDEAPPVGALPALYSHITRIRRALEKANGAGGLPLGLVRRPGGYVLGIDPEQVDLHRFRRLITTARDPRHSDAERAGLLREALSVWRGTPLADLPGGWAARMREAWRMQRLDLVVQWAQTELRLGRHDEVIGPVRELAAEHPLAERLVAVLMRALAAAGRDAEALDYYATSRARLVDELGTDPGPELRAMHGAILRGELDRQGPIPQPIPSVGGAALVPAQLPADVAAFTGRAEELSELGRLLTSAASQTDEGAGGSSAVVISALAGTAGVGKTALAVHVAHQLREAFRDGQLFVNLRGYDVGPPLTPVQALAQLLGALGVKADDVPVELDAAAGLYRSLLAGKRMLLVLDDARDANQVRPLLPGDPGCAVLVTSRDRLTGLIASHGAHRLTLDTLTPSESVVLLGRILGPDRVAAEPQAARELAELCGLLPLALRIAAANLIGQPDQSINSYVAELSSGDRLAGLAVEDDPHLAVGAAFDCSYQRLGPDARRLFRLLGLIPGPEVTAGAAAALAGMSPPQAVRLLGRLASAHLIERRGPGRFALHDLLRRYARQRAGQQDGHQACQAAVRRLLGWYLHTADAAARLLYPRLLRLPIRATDAQSPPAAFDDHAGALAWLDAERANLVAAASHAAEHGPGPVAWLLADALGGYFQQRRHTVDWLTVVHAGLAAATAEGDLPAQAAVRLSLGTADLMRGRYAQAIEHYTAASELAGQASWTDGQASSLNHLGNAYLGMGRLQQAAERYTEALALHRQTGRLAGQAVNLNNLGWVSRELGRLRQAADHQTQALAIYRQIGARADEANTLEFLGDLNHAMGHFDQAITHLDHALALHREVVDHSGQAYDLNSLAAVHRDAGRLPQALDLARAAVTLAREMGDRRTEADVRNTLGSVHLRLGHVEQALDHYRQALDLARELGNPRAEMIALLGLATTHQRVGHHSQSMDHAQQALTIASQTGHRIVQGQAHIALAAANLGLGRHDEATRHAHQALAIHRQTGHRLGQASSLAALGQAFHHTSNADAALSCWRESLALFKEIGSDDADDVCALADTQPSSALSKDSNGGRPGEELAR
jgi:tetratricopeptide (TPR) repeat protein/DNA-binding SARP family transcriptional activator